MCGLFGYALKEAHPRLQQIITQLALYNENRGQCSWGAYLKEGDELIKDVGPIGLSLSRIPSDRAGIMIGHTRASTVGATTQPNAHPFEFIGEGGRVIGAHNGGISNHRELNTKNSTSLEVDSMHIFYYIANNKPMKDLEGYGAITFLKNDMLFLSRFAGGVLSVARMEDGGGIFWSSEEGALNRTLVSAGVKFSSYNLAEDKVYFYRDGAIYQTKDVMPIKRWSRPNYTGQNDNFFRGYSNRTSSPRTEDPIIIRFHITHPEAVTVDDELDAIKAKIFNDKTITDHRSYSTACSDCRESTMRYYVKNGISMCLSCIAKRIKNERTVDAVITTTNA